MSASAKINNAHIKNYSDTKKNVNVLQDPQKVLYSIHVDL